MALPLVTMGVAAAAFDVTPADMGLAVSAYVVGMAASSLPAGLLSDRIGTGRVLTLYFWLLTATVTACALAESYAVFVAAHAAMGLASGCFHPAGLGLVSLITPRDRLGRAMGWFGVWGSLGTVAAPLAMGSSLGWRFGFMTLAALALGGALACQVGLSRGWLPAGTHAQAVRNALQRETGRSNQVLVLLLLVMGMNAFLSTGWETVFPQTVADQGLQVVSPWMISTFVLFVGGLGQYVGGLLARDAFAAPRYAVILVIQCLVLLGTATALDTSLRPYALLGSFAFLNYGTQPIENRLLAAFTSTRRRATAFALKFVVALVIAAPAPWCAAWLYQRSGDAAVYRLLSGLALVGVFVGYFFLRASRLQGRRRPG